MLAVVRRLTDARKAREVTSCRIYGKRATEVLNKADLSRVAKAIEKAERRLLIIRDASSSSATSTSAVGTVEGRLVLLRELHRLLSEIELLDSFEDKC